MIIIASFFYIFLPFSYNNYHYYMCKGDIIMVFLVNIGFNRHAVGRRGEPWPSRNRFWEWEFGKQCKRAPNCRTSRGYGREAKHKNHAKVLIISLFLSKKGIF